MSNNYKIKVDEKELSPERIDSHKNFGKVLADYHNLTQPLYKRPLYKNPKTFAGLVLILSIAGLVFLAIREEEAATKTATSDSLNVAKENIIFAPAFSQVTGPLAVEVPAAQNTRIPGIRGTFNFPQLDKPLTILDYRSANDLVATGVHSMDANENDIAVEKIIHMQGSVNRPISFTWEQTRDKREEILLHRWDSQTHHWVPVQMPQRETVKIEVKKETDPGEDGFKAIEFGNDAQENPEVKSHSTDGQTTEQEKYTWNIQLPGMYRMSHRIMMTSNLLRADISPVDGSGEPLKLQRLLLVYEDGNLQNMEADKAGKWNCDRRKGAIAAYGFTTSGELVYAPSSVLITDGSAMAFTPWSGPLESPEILLRKLFEAQH